MINVQVKGFQSIEDLTLSIEGFTAIIGRSNIGKSALVRALKCALTNAEGVWFVRHGPDCARVLRGVKKCKCQSSVHIVSEGFDLLWEKGDLVHRYEFNGKNYESPDRGLPDFLSLSGLDPVRVGSDSGCIQISDQFFPIFLLNQSGGVVAETISDVSRLNRINRATKLVEKDRRDLQSTKKVLEGDVDKIRIRLCAYDNLDDALAKAGEVEHRFEAIEVSTDKLNTIKEFIAKITTLGLRIKALKGVDSVEVPDLGSIETAKSKVEQLQEFADSYSYREAEVAELLWVDELQVPDSERLTQAGSRLQELSGYVSEYSRRQAAVANLEWVEGLDGKIPEIAGITESSGKLDLMNSWLTRMRLLKLKFEALKKISDSKVPDPDQLRVLQDKVGTLSRYASKVKLLSDSIASLQSDLTRVEQEEKSLQEEIDVLGVCPTCVRPLTLEHSHA